MAMTTTGRHTRAELIRMIRASAQASRDREPERQAERAIIRAMYDQSNADLVRMGLPPRLNPLRDENGDPFPPVDPAV